MAKNQTIRFAKAFIQIAHQNNKVDATLSDNIDRSSRNYGQKALNVWNGERDRQALIVTLPLNNHQYQTIRQHSKQWF